MRAARNSGIDELTPVAAVRHCVAVQWGNRRTRSAPQARGPCSRRHSPCRPRRLRPGVERAHLRDDWLRHRRAPRSRTRARRRSTWPARNPERPSHEGPSPRDLHPSQPCFQGLAKHARGRGDPAAPHRWPDAGPVHRPGPPGTHPRRSRRYSTLARGSNSDTRRTVPCTTCKSTPDTLRSPCPCPTTQRREVVMGTGMCDEQAASQRFTACPTATGRLGCNRAFRILCVACLPSDLP